MFQGPASQAAVNMTRGSSLLSRVSRKKGAAPGTIHHQVITAVVPTMLWGSETWWPGARHILDQISPAYKILAHTITRLPSWTPQPILPGDAGLPPLELLSNRTSQSYGIQIIQQKDDDLCKHALLRALSKPGNATGAGLQ